MKILKKITILILLIILYTFILAFNYSKAVSSNISDSVFRLHVIANSDSLEDQNLKYIVRDNILKYMQEITSNITNKEEIIDTISNHLSDFKEVAQNTVYENGFVYGVDVEIGNFEFPTKTYGDISFPAGFYDAIRIKIGNAQGQNWWCVMFPPLCFIDVTAGIVPEESKEILESELNTEEYKLISQSNKSIKVKFKLVELLKNFESHLF